MKAGLGARAIVVLVLLHLMAGCKQDPSQSPRMADEADAARCRVQGGIPIDTYAFAPNGLVTTCWYTDAQ